MNFVGIVGTNASFSYNRKLLWYMKKHFSSQVNIEIQEIAELPLFSEDIKEVPLRVREIAHAIEAADGIIFSTPEYDHSITAALKSLIEWLSWGDLHPLTNTPVMIVGVSLGNMGTVFAQENLRQILSSPGLDAFVLPGNQFLLGRAAQSFDDNGALTDERTVGWLEHCFESFRAYTETLKPLRAAGQNRGTEASKTAAIKKYLQEGKGWAIEDISLLSSSGTDADTGSSTKQEEELDADTGSSKAESSSPAVAMPLADTQLIDGGTAGWWIEAISLNDADTGSSKKSHDSAENDANTGSSSHTHNHTPEEASSGKVALGPAGQAREKGQPDSSTGASQH